MIKKWINRENQEKIGNFMENDDLTFEELKKLREYQKKNMKLIESKLKEQRKFKNKFFNFIKKLKRKV